MHDLFLGGLVARKFTDKGAFAHHIDAVAHPDQLRELRGVDITEEGDRAASETLNADLASGRRPAYQLDKRYRRKDGQLVWVNANAALFPATDGTGSFYAAMILDITDRRRAKSPDEDSPYTADRCPFVRKRI